MTSLHNRDEIELGESEVAAPLISNGVAVNLSGV
jgi:hypothetical protein